MVNLINTKNPSLLSTSPWLAFGTQDSDRECPPETKWGGVSFLFLSNSSIITLSSSALHVWGRGLGADPATSPAQCLLIVLFTTCVVCTVVQYSGSRSRMISRFQASQVCMRWRKRERQGCSSPFIPLFISIAYVYKGSQYKCFMTTHLSVFHAINLIQTIFSSPLAPEITNPDPMQIAPSLLAASTCVYRHCSGLHLALFSIL